VEIVPSRVPRNWQYALQETVGTNGYVPMPERVRRTVEEDHPLDGPSVFWNYERHSNYVVLSRRSLQGTNYVGVGRYRVYDADTDGQVRIRPPDSLTEVVRSNFAEGSRVMYLAYEEMTAGENPTVYLLSEGQLLDLLPEEAGTRPGDLSDAILNTPGFLPAP
jgi:hypothetical protein